MNDVQILKEKLMGEYSCATMKQLYEKETGVSLKTKDKARVAEKLAAFRVEHGSKQSSPKDEPEVKPTRIVVNESSEVLKRAKAAWESLEKLKDEKKFKVAELNKKIADERTAIADVLANGHEPKEKLMLVEEHWNRLSSGLNEKAEVSRDYNARIKDCRKSLKSVFDNIRQLPLPL